MTHKKVTGHLSYPPKKVTGQMSTRQTSAGQMSTHQIPDLYPTVVGIGWNVTVLHLSPDICLRTCDTVAHRPNPSAFYGSFKMFKISTSEHHISHYYSPSLVSPTDVLISMYVSACLIHMVTEGTVYGLRLWFALVSVACVCPTTI